MNRFEAMMQWLEGLANGDTGGEVTIFRTAEGWTALLGLYKAIRDDLLKRRPHDLRSPTLEGAVEGLLRDYANKMGPEEVQRFQRLPPRSS